MKEVVLRSGKNWEHLEVAPGSLFYMNHMKEQEAAEAHDHNFLEFAFVLKGRAKHYTVQGVETCRAGDVFIIPIGAWHSYGDCRGLEIYNCLFSPKLLKHELGWLSTDPAWSRWLEGDPGSSRIPGLLRLSRPRRERVRKILEDLERTYRRGGAKLKMLGYLFLLFNEMEPAIPTPAVGKQTMPPAVSQAIELLHQELQREWRLDDLAAEVHLSPAYLVRLFRTAKGIPPMSYLERIRAEQAATLLLSSPLRIGEIGELVGWPEAKHFARVFRRVFGCSASEYRRKYESVVRSKGE